MKKNPSVKTQETEEEFPGYPKYPSSEDIYARAEKLNYADPEELEDVLGQTPLEATPPATHKKKDKEYQDDPVTGDDLDVPGAELDDQQEETGNEDEENNYYSTGGDNHADLDEQNDDQIPL